MTEHDGTPEPPARQARNGRREQRPSFQFYPQDFLASDSVAQMTHEEVGVYILLLCRAWVGPGLPVEIARVARLVGITEERFAALWAGPLGSCFEERDGRLVNARMERERDLSSKKSIERAKAGARGGKARALLKQTDAFAQANTTTLLQQSCSKGDGVGWDGISEGEPEREIPDPFPWPDWVDASKRDTWVQGITDAAFSFVDVRSSCAYLDGVRQAIAQVTAPRPNETALDRMVRESSIDVVDTVVSWLHHLDGRGRANATGALRKGPLAALWRHPRLQRDDERNQRERTRREEGSNGKA